MVKFSFFGGKFFGGKIFSLFEYARFRNGTCPGESALSGATAHLEQCIMLVFATLLDYL